MKKQMFDKLVASIKEAGQIHRGEANPSGNAGVPPADQAPSRRPAARRRPFSRRGRRRSA